MVERLWLTRLRWRMRGAWLWPAYFGLTLLDGVLITALPPYDWTPPGLVGGVLLAGFANLFLLAVVAPFAGRRLRRMRPDLPRPVAFDYAGTGLVCALTVTILAAGIVHRPAVAAQRDAEAARDRAVSQYVHAHAPAWRDGLAATTVHAYADDYFRVCVPGDDPRRWLCLLVDTDPLPPQLVRDESMAPNPS